MAFVIDRTDRGGVLGRAAEGAAQSMGPTLAIGQQMREDRRQRGANSALVGLGKQLFGDQFSGALDQFDAAQSPDMTLQALQMMEGEFETQKRIASVESLIQLSIQEGIIDEADSEPLLAMTKWMPDDVHKSLMSLWVQSNSIALEAQRYRKQAARLRELYVTEDGDPELAAYAHTLAASVESGYKDIGWARDRISRLEAILSTEEGRRLWAGIRDLDDVERALTTLATKNIGLGSDPFGRVSGTTTGPQVNAQTPSKYLGGGMTMPGGIEIKYVTELGAQAAEASRVGVEQAFGTMGQFNQGDVTKWWKQLDSTVRGSKGDLALIYKRIENQVASLPVMSQLASMNKGRADKEIRALSQNIMKMYAEHIRATAGK